MVITPNQPRFRAYQACGFPVEQLLEEPYISREPGGGTRVETEQFVQQLGVNPARLKIAVEVRSTESLKKMVSEGVGLAVLSLIVPVRTTASLENSWPLTCRVPCCGESCI